MMSDATKDSLCAEFDALTVDEQHDVRVIMEAMRTRTPVALETTPAVGALIVRLRSELAQSVEAEVNEATRVQREGFH